MPTAYSSYRSELKFIDRCHYATVPLMILIVGIGLYRFLSKTIRSRLDIMPMSIAFKSLLFLAYMVTTSHVAYFQRKKKERLTIYMVLNFIEVPSWIAAAILPVVGMIRGSDLAGYILGSILVAASAIVGIISLPVAFFSYRHWAYRRRYGVHPGKEELGHKLDSIDSGSEEMAYQPNRAYV